jgi:flagellar hook-basal body protein
MSFYTSLTGLNSATSQLAVTSNNIANSGTTAFKRSRADFGDIFSTSPLQKSSAQIGQGVLLKGVNQEFSQGNISTSGNSLDLAITGDGFFPLKTADGLQDIYTRNGAFMLNEQNNVVNSTGQRLMAASVDSSGTADLSNLSALTIPSQTTGEAQKTTEVKLGLNLPADAAVIDAKFDRTDPSTYNESTALTVYDDSGEGYLATIYYVKTQTANIGTPESKWQTYFFIGDQAFNSRLQQVTNESGQYLEMNGHGDMRYVTARASQKVGMFRYDENVTKQNSVPATTVSSVPYASTIIDADDNIEVTGDNLKFDFTLTVDGVSQAINLDLTGDADVVDDEIAGDDLASKLTVAINNAFSDPANTSGATPAVEPKYGMKVVYEEGQFSFSSGSTGDSSSIEFSDVDKYDVQGINTSTGASQILGVSTDNAVYAISATDNAVRGKVSDAAVLKSDPVILKSDGTMTIASDLDIEVVVNGVKSNFTLDIGNSSLKPSVIAGLLEQGINYPDAAIDQKVLQDDGTAVTESGQKLRGVTVEFDETTNQFTVTSPTTGSASVIDIVKIAETTGDKAEVPELFGFANTTRAVGVTNPWVNLSQHTVNGTQTFVELGDDGYYEEVTDPSGVDSTINSETWKPVFLDPGELTFTLNGEALSPFMGIPFTARIVAGQDTNIPISDMTIDLTRSSQYTGTFSVLSQSQDGQPEGDLMGLDIGGDGLVNASFSNGTQKSLGKIILANFASPSGLRQMGDSSFLASASSGDAKIGEAGSSGFGSIRAGAIERSNVDLTQELVDLITAQRNFQANAKAIETSNTLTQAIINIRG